ncbi:hypothetical protein N9L49_05780, partial [Rhodospirillales bacterium]|nr:hypothetical protein [Rhodospirillales bacterium]
MKCLFQLAVWGDEYVGNFLNIALPTLMAPGNLPTKLKSADSTFRIYITESGRESLLNSPLFVSMQNVINVELIDIEYPRQTNKFSSLN